MARQNTSELREIIEAAVDRVVRRVSARIAAAAEELAKEKAQEKRAAPARGCRRRPGRARRPAEIAAWTTDRRARRVPKFVIEMTGLDTKKKLVAKFGESVTSRRGQPLPPAKQMTPPIVAKPARIRNASAA